MPNTSKMPQEDSSSSVESSSSEEEEEEEEVPSPVIANQFEAKKREKDEKRDPNDSDLDESGSEAESEPTAEKRAPAGKWRDPIAKPGSASQSVKPVSSKAVDNSPKPENENEKPTRKRPGSSIKDEQAKKKRKKALEEEEEEEKEEEDAESDYEKSGSDESSSETETECMPEKLVPSRNRRSQIPKSGSAPRSVKSTSSKPMDDSPQSKRAKATGQRSGKSSREKIEKNEKIRKVSEANGEPDVVQNERFRIFWPKEDEIRFLIGLQDFINKGGDISALKEEFVQTMKPFMHKKFRPSQLLIRIKCLKQKYQRNVKKGKKLVFKTPQDRIIYEMSEKMWGEQGILSTRYGVSKAEGSKGSVAANGKNKAKKQLRFSSSDESLSWGGESCFGFAPRSDLMKKGLHLLDSSSVLQLEEKWRELHVMEMEVHMKRAELVEEHTRLILEVL